MGAPKTTGTAAADCLRCTALLLTGTSRCSLCGWPVGAPFPPVEHQPQPAAERPAEAPDESPAPAATAEADDSPAVQSAQPTQAAGEAQTPPERPSEPAPVDVEHAQLDALAEHLDRVEEPIEVITLDDPLTAPLPALDVHDPAPAEPAARPTGELLDPLTAPLEMLTGDPSDAQAGAPQHVEPPAADDTPHGVANEPDGSDGSDGEDQADAPAAPGRLGRLAQAVGLLMLTVGLVNVGGVVLGSMLRDDPGSSVATVALAVSGVTLLLWMAAAISFIVWVHQARARVGLVSDARQRWSPTLSTVGWVIPVAGMYIGWQVLRDLWSGSDPAAWAYPDDVEPPAPTKPQVVDAWLLALVVAAGVGVTSTWVLDGGLPMDVIGAFAMLLSAGCLALVVRQVSAWQDDAFAGADVELDSWAEAETQAPETSFPEDVVEPAVETADSAELAELAETSPAR